MNGIKEVNRQLFTAPYKPRRRTPHKVIKRSTQNQAEWNTNYVLHGKKPRGAYCRRRLQGPKAQLSPKTQLVTPVHKTQLYKGQCRFREVTNAGDSRGGSAYPTPTLLRTSPSTPLARAGIGGSWPSCTPRMTVISQTGLHCYFQLLFSISSYYFPFHWHRWLRMPGYHPGALLPRWLPEQFSPVSSRQVWHAT